MGYPMALSFLKKGAALAHESIGEKSVAHVPGFFRF